MDLEALAELQAMAPAMEAINEEETKEAIGQFIVGRCNTCGKDLQGRGIFYCERHAGPRKFCRKHLSDAATIAIVELMEGESVSLVSEEECEVCTNSPRDAWVQAQG